MKQIEIIAYPVEDLWAVVCSTCGPVCVAHDSEEAAYDHITTHNPVKS